MGYNLIECNASDTRSKNSINQLLGIVTVGNYLLNQKKDGELTTKNKNNLILMDECDGVSAGDRGGI